MFCSPQPTGGAAAWRHGLAGSCRVVGAKLLSHQARAAHQRQRVTNSNTLSKADEPGKYFHHAQTELEPLFGKSSRHGDLVVCLISNANPCSAWSPFQLTTFQLHIFLSGDDAALDQPSSSTHLSTRPL
jgi:hypothetical protein